MPDRLFDLGAAAGDELDAQMDEGIGGITVADITIRRGPRAALAVFQPDPAAR